MVGREGSNFLLVIGLEPLVGIASPQTAKSATKGMVATGNISLRSGSGCTQVAVIAVLTSIATAAFLYSTIIILPTAQKLKSGDTTSCRIVAADLACWRRSFISFSQIEQGHHACWVFKVERNDTASPRTGSSFNDTLLNTTSDQVTVQYAPVHEFSKARDACNSFETCGNATWTCTVVTSTDDGAAPSMLRMRWRYPLKKLAANLTVSVSCYAIAALMVCQYLRQRATCALEELCEDLPPPKDEEGALDIVTEDGRDDAMPV